VKQHAAFKWKDAISEFPVSPGSAESLIRWVEKIKNLFIAYFRSNKSTKNYQNRFMYVKVITRQSSDSFWHSVVITDVNRILLIAGQRRSTCPIRECTVQQCHLRSSTVGARDARVYTFRRVHAMTKLCWLIILIELRFYVLSTQNRSLRRRSPSQSVGLVWKN